MREIKFLLFADDMILYIENPKESNKKYWTYSTILVKQQYTNRHMDTNYISLH